MKAIVFALILFFPNIAFAELHLCAEEDYSKPKSWETINTGSFGSIERKGQIAIVLANGYLIPLAKTGCYDLSGNRKRIGDPVKIHLNSKADTTKISYLAAAIVQSGGTLPVSEQPGQLEVKLRRNEYAIIGDRIYPWWHLQGAAEIQWPSTIPGAGSLENSRIASRYFYEAPLFRDGRVVNLSPSGLENAQAEDAPIVNWLGLLTVSSGHNHQARLVVEDAAEYYRKIFLSPKVEIDETRNINVEYSLTSFVSDPDPSFDNPILKPRRNQVCMYINYRIDGATTLPEEVGVSENIGEVFVLRFFQGAKC